MMESERAMFLNVCVLSTEVLANIVEFADLWPVMNVSSSSRYGRNAIRSILPADCCEALNEWSRKIWKEHVSDLNAIANAAADKQSPAMLQVFHCSIADILNKIAAMRNQRPLHLRAHCFARRDNQQLQLYCEFFCPRGCGKMRKIGGTSRLAEAQQRLRRDDFVIDCNSCNRAQIEDDAIIFHCSRMRTRKHTCYDLCIVCAETLFRHRRKDEQ
mmetsp:Transcript_68400/g.119750  ORF Transcript_68400/g.119750 Transcript_68400/m.119750 type:complete len:215 (+) Transcript_68400:38-682(+)